MGVMYKSIASKVSPRTFGCIAMCSVHCSVIYFNLQIALIFRYK